MASEISNAKIQHDKIIKNILGEEIQRVEIFYIPTYVLTLKSINQDWLEKHYYYKVIMTHLDGSKKYKNLYKAIESEKISVISNNNFDLRWGCVFYNDQNEKILSIYLTKDGKRGFVQNEVVCFNGSIFNWLKRNFRQCFE